MQPRQKHWADGRGPPSGCRWMPPPHPQLRPSHKLTSAGPSETLKQTPGCAPTRAQSGLRGRQRHESACGCVRTALCMEQPTQVSEASGTGPLSRGSGFPGVEPPQSTLSSEGLNEEPVDLAGSRRGRHLHAFLGHKDSEGHGEVAGGHRSAVGPTSQRSSLGGSLGEHHRGAVWESWESRSPSALPRAGGGRFRLTEDYQGCRRHKPTNPPQTELPGESWHLETVAF